MFAVIRSKTKLTLGSGRVYFDPFAPGTKTLTGERYVGNTPAFSVTRSVESTTRVRSLRGRTLRSDPIIISETFTASVTTDNMNLENIADWYGADLDQSLLGGISINANFVLEHNKTYSLNEFAESVDASSSIEQIRVFKNGAEVSLDNFDLSDLKYGRFRLSDYPKGLFYGETISVLIQTKTIKRSDITLTQRSVSGRLRFASKNIVGADCEYVYPHATMTCSGALDFKGEGFQSLTFNVEMYPLDAATPVQLLRVIEDFRISDINEAEIGTSIESFADSEDLFDRIITSELPTSTFVHI